MISLITFPSGGPFVWARQLEKELKKRGLATRFYAGRKDYWKALKDKHDIIHTSVPLPFLRCDKYILTIKGDYKKEKLIARPFFDLAIKKADVITVPSEFLKNTLRIKKASVIPNGVSFPKTIKASYSLKSNIPFLGIMTNFDFRKKADGLLSLAKILNKDFSKVKLLIAGNGKFIEEYKERILKIHPNTEFLGHCQKEELFDQIDIFTYYSFLDNQPNALLEAMAFGLPVMSNVVGSIEEILSGKMENYIARNGEDYKKILEKLLNSETMRKENGEEAKKISQNFSWDKIVDKFIEIYEN